MLGFRVKIPVQRLAIDDFTDVWRLDLATVWSYRRRQVRSFKRTSVSCIIARVYGCTNVRGRGTAQQYRRADARTDKKGAYQPKGAPAY